MKWRLERFGFPDSHLQIVHVTFQEFPRLRTEEDECKDHRLILTDEVANFDFETDDVANGQIGR